MKKFALLKLALSLSVFASFAACDKDSDSNTPGVDNNAKTFAVTVYCADGWGDVYITKQGVTTTDVEQGKNVVLHAVPATGCVFVRWDGVVNGNDTTIANADCVIRNVQSNASFTAIFSKKVFGNVIFEDNFEQNGSMPDPAKWELCARGSSAWCRHMSESYDQAYVESGNLVLVGEVVDGEYKAGGVRMHNDLGFKYGRVEVRARFTKMAQGSWPAIWMMPSEPVWNGWPQCGEIDIMEHLNKDRTVWNVIHSNYVDNLGHTTNPAYSATPAVDTDQFNVFAIDWDADAITFSVNGNTTLTYPNLHLNDNDDVKQWPFDTTFYLILNNALGGAGTWPGAITNSQLPAIFEIDYVKVTEYTIETSE